MKYLQSNLNPAVRILGRSKEVYNYTCTIIYIIIIKAYFAKPRAISGGGSLETYDGSAI